MGYLRSMLDDGSSPLASAQTFALCSESIAKAQAALKRVTNNPRLGNRFSSALGQVQAVLAELTARPVSAGDSLGCTVLHQVKYATVELLHFLAQYEAPPFAPVAVFAEAYNAQANHILNRLMALKAACSRCLTDFETLRLRHQSLQRYQASRTFENFAADLTFSGAAPVSLPELLNDAGCSDVHPAMTAAMWGQFQEMERTLQTVDVSRPTAATYSLLHVAVLWQSPHAVATLLAAGADVNAPTRADGLFAAGSTPLHLAVALGNVAIVKLLLGWGANPKALDSRRGTPASLPLSKACGAVLTEAAEVQRSTQEACHAAYNGFSHKLFGILAKSEIPVNVKYQSTSRYFLIHQVAFSGDLEAYHLLLEAGASPLLRTRDGLLASAVALNAGRPELAAKFMQAEDAERANNADPPRRVLPLTAVFDGDAPTKLEIPTPLSRVVKANGAGLPRTPTVDVPQSPLSASNLSPNSATSPSPGGRRPTSPLKDAIASLTHKVTDRIRRSSRGSTGSS
eukprot:EG_transcript_6451